MNYIPKKEIRIKGLFNNYFFFRASIINNKLYKKADAFNTLLIISKYALPLVNTLIKVYSHVMLNKELFKSPALIIAVRALITAMML